MKLTHDKVRALRDVQQRALHGCACPGNCACCDWSTTAVALADEWLARRTVRWADDSDERSGRLYCDEPGRWYGFFVRRLGRFDGFDARVNEQRGIDAEGAILDTLAEARAWLEERAREAGYEVEGTR